MAARAARTHTHTHIYTRPEAPGLFSYGRGWGCTACVSGRGDERLCRRCFRCHCRRYTMSRQRVIPNQWGRGRGAFMVIWDGLGNGWGGALV